jgi:hypothetical protein
LCEPIHEDGNISPKKMYKNEMHVGCPFSMDGDQWDMLVPY